MLVMKKSGVFNLMQDEASCLAVGMPKKAIIAGGADKITPCPKFLRQFLPTSQCSQSEFTRV